MKKDVGMETGTGRAAAQGMGKARAGAGLGRAVCAAAMLSVCGAALGMQDDPTSSSSSSSGGSQGSKESGGAGREPGGNQPERADERDASKAARDGSAGARRGGVQPPLEESPVEITRRQIEEEGITDPLVIEEMMEEARQREELIRQARLATEAAARRAAGMQPGEVGEGDAVVESDEEYIEISAVSEQVPIKTIVEGLQIQLGLQIMAIDAGLDGQHVILTVPLRVKRTEAMRFLVSLLEQKGYTLTKNEFGIFVIVPVESIVASGIMSDDPFSPTRVIQVPGMKPSSIKGAVDAWIGSGGGTKIAPAYLDELGIIIATGTPGETQRIADTVARVIREYTSMEYIPYELEHVAASYALTRILELAGGGGTPTGLTAPAADGTRPAQGDRRGTAAAGAGTMWLNLAERLTVDPQGNRLWFHGRRDETVHLDKLVMMVDMPNGLVSKWYPVGTSTATALAAEGKRLGLGDVDEHVADDRGLGTGFGSSARLRLNQGNLQQGLQGSGATAFAGPGFTIYPDSGGLMYRGTVSQHAQVEQLAETFRKFTDTELIVVEFYKLKNSTAADVADVINAIISNQQPEGRSSFLGDDLSRGSRRNDRNRNQPTPEQPSPAGDGSGNAAGEAAIVADENTFVQADEKNNQIIVKAAKRLQPQFKRLIEKLDLRRPQVFIEATIVSVGGSDTTRLAIETQLMSGQWGMQTNFGLTNPGANFQSPRVVAPNLAGLTTALIKSQYVPFVLTALTNENNGRILSSPKLLVEDNEEASIASTEQQPTATVSQGDATTETGFGGYESAGTDLSVTPTIAEGGYLSLDFSVTLSEFQGAGTATLPPAKLERTISSKVTVPADTTIVVGGIEVKDVGKTVVKIPLLGDIPLIGAAFRDTTDSSSEQLLYVFITPKILRDATFDDLRLLARGPMVATDVGDGLPELLPVRIEILELVDGELRRRPEPLPAGSPLPEPVPAEGAGEGVEREPAPVGEPVGAAGGGETGGAKGGR